MDQVIVKDNNNNQKPLMTGIENSNRKLDGSYRSSRKSLYFRSSCHHVPRRQKKESNCMMMILSILILIVLSYCPYNVIAFQPRTTMINSRRIITKRSPSTRVISRFQHHPFINNNIPLHSYNNRRQRQNSNWEGDDVRWFSKLRRNVRRSVFTSVPGQQQGLPVRNTLILLNIVIFIYQCIDSIRWIKYHYPSAWSKHTIAIIWDTIIGQSRPGPLMKDFAYVAALAQRQPHRYITAGFLHGSIIHLFLNMDALRRLPYWLESGLGSTLFVTVFLISIITGNLACFETTNAFCIGASGGICGLYGLLYVSLVRMGNHTAAWRVIKGMVTLLIYGILLTNVSNAGHIGGFVGGIIAAFLLGPNYRKSYSLRRKNSLQVDLYTRDYRTAMGYDKMPSGRGIIPLPIFWVGAIIFLLSKPVYRSAPKLILRGLLHPGSLYRWF